jgi:serine/threonine protein kinase
VDSLGTAAESTGVGQPKTEHRREVYLARDTQLKREVALKVLPAALSSGPDSLARFQCEAELLASLDHPNIGHIHGMVQADHNWALVLALIEGPTLADSHRPGSGLEGKPKTVPFIPRG